MWLEGLLTALQPVNILFLILGTIFGLIIGALPGLGPLFAVALMLPLTYGMNPATAIILLAAVHAATAYGDSFASILINTPGGVGSVASCWDGYPMTQKGQAGVAMGISTLGSFLGGILGWISLVSISPLLMRLALRLGPPEYFAIAIMALSLLALASGGQILKGIFLGGIGLLLSFIGSDPITAQARFTFGSLYLQDGLPLAPVVLGLFALSQVLVLSEHGGTIAQIQSVGKVADGFKKVLQLPKTVLRAGLVGIFMGHHVGIRPVVCRHRGLLCGEEGIQLPRGFRHRRATGRACSGDRQECMHRRRSHPDFHFWNSGFLGGGYLSGGDDDAWSPAGSAVLRTFRDPSLYSLHWNIAGSVFLFWTWDRSRPSHHQNGSDSQRAVASGNRHVELCRVLCHARIRRRRDRYSGVWFHRLLA